MAENFEYPVKAYEKFNGYLGICAGEIIDNDKDWLGDDDFRIWCASKSTDEGWYAARFEDLLRDSLGCSLGRFARDLWDIGCTAVFEVIDPVNDPHIIEYDKPHIQLLALVFNDNYDMDFSCKTDEVVEFYNATWKLPYQPAVAEFWNEKELYDWYDKVTAPGYTFNGRNIEGFVLRDLDDHQVKVKTDHYLFLKAMRSFIPRIRQGKEITLKKINKKKHPEYKELLEIIDKEGKNWYNLYKKDIPIIEVYRIWKEDYAEEISTGNENRS